MKKEKYQVRDAQDGQILFLGLTTLRGANAVLRYWQRIMPKALLVVEKI